jgi:hypothetical protein
LLFIPGPILPVDAVDAEDAVEAGAAGVAAGSEALLDRVVELPPICAQLATARHSAITKVTTLVFANIVKPLRDFIVSAQPAPRRTLVQVK